MRQTKLRLTKQDRDVIEQVRRKGLHRAREVNRAHVLAALDANTSEEHIRKVLGVSRSALWRTRSAYIEGGVQYALYDAPRPGQPKKYGVNEEAEVVATVCSQPPSGCKRWTIKLLVEALRQHPKLQKVSRETIRRFLKKTS